MQIAFHVVVVFPDRFKTIDKLGHQSAAVGIFALGPVEGDPGDALFLGNLLMIVVFAAIETPR
jgi:hypothetical protein